MNKYFKALQQPVYEFTVYRAHPEAYLEAS